MKAFLIILLVCVILFLMVCGYFWFNRDHYIMDGPGMVCESGPLQGMHWAQSASYAEGCFSFALSYDESEEIYRIEAHAWDEAENQWITCEEKPLSAEKAAEILDLINASNPVLLALEETGNDELFALDETTVSFTLQYANWPEDSYCPPSGDIALQLYTLLLNAAK